MFRCVHSLVLFTEETQSCIKDHKRYLNGYPKCCHFFLLYEVLHKLDTKKLKILTDHIEMILYVEVQVFCRTEKGEMNVDYFLYFSFRCIQPAFH